MDEVRSIYKISSGEIPLVSKSVPVSKVKQQDAKPEADVDVKPVEDSEGNAPIISKLDIESVKIANRDVSVKFSSSDQSEDGGINFQVIDKESGEVISQFPREQIVKALKERESKQGLLIDTRA